MIGAYRDNEVSAINPLRRTLDTIHHAGATAQEISPGTPSCHDVRQLMADALRCELAFLAPLHSRRMTRRPAITLPSA